MHKSTVVSVVIPAYNEENYIGRLLEDLSEQSYKEFEVVVADAKSTDNTVKVINSFADKLNIKVVEQPPKNPGAGRNIGVSHAKGEWLLFLDADDTTDDPNFIKTLLEKTLEHGWKTSSAKMTVDKTNSLTERIGTSVYYSYLKLISHTKHPIAPGACIFTHRDTFHKYNGFNEKITFGEDNDYVTRTAKERFGFVGDTYFYVDMRRFREKGKHSFMLMSIRNEVHRLTHGFKLDKSPFDYEFGKHHKSQENKAD